MTDWLEQLKWDEDGLVPVIAQDAGTKAVLMFAWMNRSSLLETVKKGEAIYWSRSRSRLWHKGEESGYTQKVIDIFVDCDSDVLVLLVEQTGGIACHTGRATCFYRQFKGSVSDGSWETVEPVLIDPNQIYKK
jgi:phosphoribosyl-AMP cyclohydrolase